MRSKFRSWVAGISLTFLAVFSSGCASKTDQPAPCAVVLLVGGNPVYPSAVQFETVRRTFDAQFADRNLMLVHNLSSAKFVAMIELRVRPDQPGITDMVVRDVSPNSFANRENTGLNPRDFPTIREVEAQQDRARRGLDY